VRPLVSILIPAYNSEEWLAQTLRSAVAQTWDRKEIIVVDDGSKDGTLSVARSFESDIVKVFTQANQGASAARNNALARSRGDYIQWLDADDILVADKIALQMDSLGNSPNPRTLLSGEWGEFLHHPNDAKFIPTGLWCDLSKAEWLMRKMEQNAFMQTATWLVSRELTEAAGPWDTRLLVDDDGEYFCRVLMASDGVQFVQGSRVCYRKAQSGNLSYMGTCNRKLDAFWLSMQLHIRYLRSMDDGRRAHAACLTYLETSMAVFYFERPDLVRLARALAESLGGRLEAPKFSWKYAWINHLFGWRVARLIQRSLPQIKVSWLRNFDRARLWRYRKETRYGD
jgi:glycosyltransferase involved in cell wall biosynthesis